MEERVNVAELLKDCPKGMKLDCTTWENVTFEKVRNDNIFIRRNNKQPQHDSIVVLNEYGCATNHVDEKCRIFPKGKTTWEGFQRPFKDGDIVAFDNPYGGNLQLFIFKNKEENNTLSSCYLMLDGDELDLKECMYYVTRLATEEEKQKLFDAIKANGYKWNADEKKLEKLIEPKFKVGDRIKNKNIHKYDCAVQYIIREVCSECYKTDCGVLLFENQDDYELAPTKFDINTLVPFESRVLVRDREGDSWLPAIFGCKFKNSEYPFFTMNGGSYKKCIPYDKNKELAGTANDCGEYYKTWE